MYLWDPGNPRNLIPFPGKWKGSGNKKLYLKVKTKLAKKSCFFRSKEHYSNGYLNNYKLQILTTYEFHIPLVEIHFWAFNRKKTKQKLDYKVLLYKLVTKPLWTYAIQLWRTEIGYKQALQCILKTIYLDRW